MQNNPNPQYSNENRKKQNHFNLLFTVLVAAGVAVAAGGILLLMTLLGRSDKPKAEETVSSTVVSEQAGSEASSLSVSSAEETSSAAVSSTESSSSATSSTASQIVLEGTRTAIQQSDDRLLVVVNNETKLPGSFKQNLVQYDTVKVDKSMKSDLDAMINEADNADRYIWVTYGYRTEKEQNSIYNANVKELQDSGKTKAQAEKTADETIQKGGTSEYITGLSIGLNTGGDEFAKTEEYQWMVKNGAKYGFVLRYPKEKEGITGVKFQPWRFRYVGKEHAQKMQQLGYCLEEYVTYLNTLQNSASSASSQG